MGIQEKRTSDGGIERYKARLVACGNEQVLGVNFLLNFAAVGHDKCQGYIGYYVDLAYTSEAFQRAKCLCASF